jgi:hypothetical protein
MAEEIEEKKDSTPPTPKEEKLEFLKREEIRTMQKDIARLREIEAQKERERISALKLEGTKKEEGEIAPPETPAPPEEKKAGETLIPKPLSKKPSPFKKILVRGVIVLLLLLIFSFFFWFFGVKKPGGEEVVPPAEEEIIPPEEEIIEKPEISVPPSLISVTETKNLEISQNEEIPGAIYQLMGEELPLGTFLRTVIKNTSENRLSSLKDLSQAFQIEAPEEIFQKLEPDYTLTLYSQEQGKRVAFVTKIKEKEGLPELLKAWEAELEEGISISGQKIPASVPYFKAASYQGVTFRYQTFSKDDLGICYSIFNDYFILTSSGESVLKVIDKLGEHE